jgi:5-methylcytosine-specific restriction endonuclease McrA
VITDTLFWDLQMEVAARDRARRRHRRGVKPGVRARVLERDNFTCRRCGDSSARCARLTADHIVPRALGGSDDESNLQTLCADCNEGKKARPPHEHDLRPLA